MTSQKNKIYVEWYDAYTRDSWQDEEGLKADCEPMMLCKTIGWLVDEDNAHITICHTYNPFMIMGSLHIPKCTIKRLKRFGG